MTSANRSGNSGRGRTFVLLPGAWSGPWSWERVHARLARRGHRVHTVSFSGLQPDGQVDGEVDGEWDGEWDVDAVNLQTHVDDTLAVMARHDLADVVLVGHSYSGLVAGMVTDQAPRRIVRTVYVEGFLPRDGRSLLDAFGAEQKARELADIRASGGWWPAPSAAGVAEEPDLTSADVRWLAERLVPHPARTITEPVELSQPIDDQPSTVIARAPTEPHLARLRVDHGWHLRHLDSGHWPMLSVPDRLADLLVEAADSGRD